MTYYFGAWLLMLLVVFSAVSAQEMPSDAAIHVVQRGETLFRIALQYGVTVQELASLNDIRDPNSIFVGQRLLLSSGLPSTIGENDADGDAVSSTLPSVTIVHIAQPGETLEGIAALYNIELERLLEANALDSLYVVVGQMIRIPQAVDAVNPAALSRAGGAASSEAFRYVVRPGDSVFRIANNYGVSITAIAQANGLVEPSLIYPGQTLIIPDYEPPVSSAGFRAPLIDITILPLTLQEGTTGRFRILTTEGAVVSGRFLDRQLAIGTEARGQDVAHNALVGIPIGTPAGIHPLELVVDGGGISVVETVQIQVIANAYRRETLTISSDRLNLLDPTLEETEGALVRRLVERFTSPAYFDGLLGIPAAAPVSSPFGSTRIYNAGTAQGLHTGTDFAAVTGAPIFSPAAGIVVLRDQLAIRGLATILDHGWGVYSGYWHQSESYVTIGESVTAGQVIGAVGSTGRATGAHLHWELWVNGVPVDPMQWVKQSFR